MARYSYKNSVIIDGKNRRGERISVSIDSTLFELLIAEKGSLEKTRAWVKNRLETDIGKVNSQSIRTDIYFEIAKPSVVRRYIENVEDDGQTDIEDV